MQTTFIGVADVHAGPLSDRFESFEFIDLSGVVFLGCIDPGGASRRDRFRGEIVVGLGIEDGRATTDNRVAKNAPVDNKYLVKISGRRALGLGL